MMVYAMFFRNFARDYKRTNDNSGWSIIYTPK